MAHIQRLGKKWRARYIGPDHRERSKVFARKVDAERFLAQVEADKLRGDWADPRLGKILFRDWAEEWLRTAVHRKPKTRAGHESLIRVHLVPKFGEYPLARITPMQVRAWVAERSGVMSASRLRGAYFLLSKILRSAVEVGYVAKNPCIGVELPRATSREAVFLSAEQVHDLVDAVNERHRVLVLVLAYGGLRWGEVCALRRKRVQLLRGQLEVAESLWEVGSRMGFGETKTYQRRTVVLPSFLRDMLAEQLAGIPEDPEALVFTDPQGQPLRNSSFHRQVWAPAVQASGVPADLRIHDLRHTCAALLIANRAGPKEIQEHLGHSTIRVTFDRYGHLFPESREALAEGLDATYRSARRHGDGTKPRNNVVDLPQRKGETSL